MTTAKQAYTIKPQTEVSSLDSLETSLTFPVEAVAPIVGMSKTFIRRVIGRNNFLSEEDVRTLLNQDAFSETFVPRSKVLGYLRKTVQADHTKDEEKISIKEDSFQVGDALELIKNLEDTSINAVVTSTPYWAMRVYDTPGERMWADGESCSFGLEQTPEGFIRHSVEVLHSLLPKMEKDGSIWWNIMDSYNTRTQIRGNAVETLHAMQGRDGRSWKDHEYLRYSAGHSYLKDGEQCLIPQRIAQRAAQIGYYVKSTISWCKQATTPEPQQSRVSRNIEYVLHLTRERTPKFNKAAYLQLPPSLGGKQLMESDKLSDFWYLPTSSGRDGHGAQFPIQLPARCIAISTNPGDLVLDPFMGAGTTAVAARQLGRHYIGFDVSTEYLATAERIVKSSSDQQTLFTQLDQVPERLVRQYLTENLSSDVGK